MFSNPLSTAVAINAGESLAQIVIDTVPMSFQKNDPKHVKKVALSIRKMTQQIEWLKLQHKFNFFQKAKLGTTLRWQLKDAGYDDWYSKELTEWVMMRLK